MQVAVTGGTGFIGKRVVRILRERGHDVRCVVRTPEKASELAALGATLSRGDILDAESLKRAFAGCEAVLHIAASYEMGVVGAAAQDALTKNLEGTRNALEAATGAGAKKIVYTSSIVVYGNTRGRDFAEGERPEAIAFPAVHPTFYAMSKARAHYEIAVPMMEAGAPIVIVQPGAVFGPSDHSTFRIFWNLLARGWPVPLGGARYGVVAVEDCALGHVLALEKGRVGECYHLVDQNLCVADFLARGGAASGLSPHGIVFPDWMLSLNASVMSVIERIVPVPDIFSSDTLRGMSSQLSLTVTTDKARRELGWSPRPIEEALRETIAEEMRRQGRTLALRAGAAPTLGAGR